VTDGTGSVTFTSIFPACYAGRWPHIHFEVYPGVNGITDSSNAVATSQVALPQEVCETVYARSEYTGSPRNLADVSLVGDNVFGEDAGALQLATVTGDGDSGYTVSLVARVDTATAPSQSGAGGRPKR
ncbi:MAG: 3,4-dioxygenase subunit beta, partial [Microbacterium sp.]|nr:3,4-dioxygenase subunit beta [Microbacterium sp.]